MESRERFQSSHTTSSDTMTDDDKKLTATDLAYWQTQMRWLIPLVQATGYQVSLTILNLTSKSLSTRI